LALVISHTDCNDDNVDWSGREKRMIAASLHLKSTQIVVNRGLLPNDDDDCFGKHRCLTRCGPGRRASDMRRRARGAIRNLAAKVGHLIAARRVTMDSHLSAGAGKAAS